MDLNHARLPIPPRWQSELQCSGDRKAAVRKINLVILQACHRLSNAASIAGSEPVRQSEDYPSFAVIEILAFSTFDTGQPFSAASAYF
jgi:hypothetical protein